VFAVAVLDRTGALLFATQSRVMPGQVGLSFDANGQVKRAYLERADEGSRVFPIASAGWIEVAGEKMRLGVYAEGTDSFAEFAALDPYLSDIVHTLETSPDRRAAV
jgi:hypothetical protein